MSLIKHIFGRTTAMIVCAILSTANIFVANSTDLSENWLLTHNFYVAAATGPWLSNNHDYVKYTCDYDYSFGGGYFEKVNDQLILKNFYISGLDVPASLDVENKTLTLDISGTHKTNAFSIDYANCTVEIYTCNFPTLTTTTDDDNVKHSTAVFTVRDEQPGKMVIPLGNGTDQDEYWGQYWDDARYFDNFIKEACWLFVVKDSEGNVKQYIPMMYPRFESIVEYDATAYDYIDDQVVRMYKVDVVFNNTAFDLKNYNALGLSNSYGSCGNTRWVNITTGLAYGDNTFHFQAKDNMQRRDYLTDFAADPQTDGDQKLTSVTFTYTGDAQTRLYRVGCYDNVDASGKAGYISGEVVNEIDHAQHNTETTKCPWVTNGGSRKTRTTLLVEFGKNGLQDQTTNEFVEKLDRTIIEWDNHDYTLDVALSINSMYYSNGKYCINGSISPSNTNTQFVDHYELCMVPQERITLTTPANSIVSNINTSETIDSNGSPYDNGFNNATNISTALNNKANAKSSVRRRANSDSSSEYNYDAAQSSYFNVEVDPSDIAKLASNGQYAVYIKAVYKEESNLTPTYHSLQTPTTTGIISGVDNISADTQAAAVTVSSNGGCARIQGDFANAKVYTPAGKLIYDGNEAMIPLNPGLYILSIDGKAFKMLIR
jgi:hypothetical protein